MEKYPQKVSTPNRLDLQIFLPFIFFLLAEYHILGISGIGSLVTMIATVHYCGSALPGRRVELYQKICDLLLGTRQKAKKIKTLLTGEQNKSVLQVLALALMERKTHEFTPSQGKDLIQEELQRVIGT